MKVMLPRFTPTGVAFPLVRGSYRDMAFVGLNVPEEVARLLDEVEVPGEKVPAADKHITILHLGWEIPIEQISAAVIAIESVTSSAVPFVVELSRISCFPKGDDGVPIISLVDSPLLTTLHDRLKDAFDKRGVPFSKKHPTFAPHVTLSYNEEAIDDRPIGPINWTVYEVILWGGDSRDRVTASFPLAFPGKMALWRNLIQARVRHSSKV